MKQSLKGLRNLAKAVYNVATLVVGGGIVTPLLNTVQGSSSATGVNLTSSIFIYGIALVLYAAGYCIDHYADKKEEAQEITYRSKHRKYHIEIPKGKLDLQIKD